MSTVNVQATQSFTVRNSDTGALQTYEYGQIYVVDSAVASAWASAGYAVEYTGAVAKPYGTKSITSNGTVDVAEYEQASVNVPNPSTGKLTITGTAEVDCKDYATAQVSDANLTAGNIKKDVTILGVTGTYEASA